MTLLDQLEDELAQGWPDPWDGLLVATQHPGWVERASCRGRGDLFFPTNGGSYSKEARALCAACPVVNQCRSAGWSEPDGMWAGESPFERRSRRRMAS